MTGVQTFCMGAKAVSSDEKARIALAMYERWRESLDGGTTATEEALAAALRAVLAERHPTPAVLEADHRGQHDFYRDQNWKKCHGCDYMEPIGMIYLPEGD